MSNVIELPVLGLPMPSEYVDFVDEAKEIIRRKGLKWEMELDATGRALPTSAWDIRRISGSHERYASRLQNFSVDQAVKALAIDQGWSEAALPRGNVLSGDVQDFIKAYVVRCSMRGNHPRSIRHWATVIARVFSATNVKPWLLCSEDVQRIMDLLDNSGVRAIFAGVGKLINENLLSVRCPIIVERDDQSRFEFAKSLASRNRDHRLPEAEALHELVRIVFQEAPRSHCDLVRFVLLRILVLTGLRVGEGLMLPADCLRWEIHTDVVSGKSAEMVGGVGRSLRLRYFAEKHGRYAPDHLIEETQWIPERFHQAVVAAVELALKATFHLRQTLTQQHADPQRYPGSDLRQFKTADGKPLTSADLLFLVVIRRADIPDPLPPHASVGPISLNAIYQGVGAFSSARPTRSLFTEYGQDGATKLKLKPHSLRHLMNTEMFRLEVPDTVITHQFGRKSVAQSYEYDHRSLAEKLRFVELPAEAIQQLRPGSPQDIVARMVVGGLINGSDLAKTFREIQTKHGDTVAFRFLVANSDGFHVTPYGFCTNSFSMNPCARHLKCFDGCRHFAASGKQEHVITLTQLQESLTSMHAVAVSKPALSVGRKNQIAHAERLLGGVGAALAAQPLSNVFPDGVDHSMAGRDLFT